MFKQILTLFLLVFVILTVVDAIQGNLSMETTVSDVLTAVVIGVAGTLLMRATQGKS